MKTASACSLILNTLTAKAIAKSLSECGMEQTDVSIADVDYTSGRKLNKSLIRHLAIHHNIETYLLPERQAAGKPTWPVHSEWKLANNILR